MLVFLLSLVAPLGGDLVQIDPGPIESDIVRVLVSQANNFVESFVGENIQKDFVADIHLHQPELPELLKIVRLLPRGALWAPFFFDFWEN